MKQIAPAFRKVMVLKLLDRYFKKILFFFFPHLDPIIPIDNLIRSIPEVILNKKVSSHIKTMKLIREACVENYSYTSDLPPSFRKEMYFATRHVYRVSNVILNVKNGVCFTESIGFLESLGSLRSWLLSRPVRRKGPAKFFEMVPVTCINTTGYAHFIMEELPRLLWALKEFPDLKLVCPDKLPVFISAVYNDLCQRNLLRYHPVKLKSEYILVDDFVFTQAEAYSGFWNKQDIGLLRKVFLGSEEKNIKTRIYISRRHSSRTFNNEAVLEETLNNRGFRIIFLEELVFTAQIEVFQNADIIIAPHGAGLANLVWCSPGTKVIELFTNHVFNDCFARLSSSLSCLHYCLGIDGIDDFSSNAVKSVIDLLDKVEKADNALNPERPDTALKPYN